MNKLTTYLISFLKITLLTLALTFIPVQKTQAGIAAGFALTGGYAVAGKLALAGLASPVAGYVATHFDRGCSELACLRWFASGLILGVILLDEDSASFQFDKINETRALELGISKESAKIFNAEVEDANIILDEVTSQLDEDSHVDQARELWTEYKEYLSAETFEVMQLLVSPSKN